MQRCLGGFCTENQASVDCRYYEIIKVIEINEIIAYIKWIYAAHLIFSVAVKSESRKMWALANKKGKSMR